MECKSRNRSVIGIGVIVKQRFLNNLTLPTADIKTIFAARVLQNHPSFQPNRNVFFRVVIILNYPFSS